MAERRGDYEIGYRRPPRATQFQKGRSGNPKGRHKQKSQLLPIDKLIYDALNSKVTIKENDGLRAISKMEAVVMQIVNKAAGGHLPSIKILLPVIELHIQQCGQVRTEEEMREQGVSREQLQAEIDERLDQIRNKLELAGALETPGE